MTITNILFKKKSKIIDFLSFPDSNSDDFLQFSKILHTVICFPVLSRQMMQKIFEQCNEKRFSKQFDYVCCIKFSKPKHSITWCLLTYDEICADLSNNIVPC